MFLLEELETANVTGALGSDFGAFITTFSATIDTAAWLSLLLLFELETRLVSDIKLRRFYTATFHLLRGFCTTIIIAACWGYISEFGTLIGSFPLNEDACALANEGKWSVLNDLDKFSRLNAHNCAAGNLEWLRLDSVDFVLVTPSALLSAQWLAFIDCLNSSAWIMVVVLLELEVRWVLDFQTKRWERYRNFVTISKLSSYAVIFTAAIYWSLEGKLLDAWDAVLWLFAFFFIESNVIHWRLEQELDSEL